MSISRRLTIASLIVVGACSPNLAHEPSSNAHTSSSSRTEVSGPTTTLTQKHDFLEGETVDFHICGEAAQWSRPTEQQQNSVWKSARYADVADTVLLDAWNEDFVLAGASASVEYDVINLSGLWSVPADTRSSCLDEANRRAIQAGSIAEIWMLRHTVSDVRKVDEAEYVIQVESRATGVQFIHFSRGQEPITLVFADRKGVEIERIVESDHGWRPSG